MLTILCARPVTSSRAAMALGQEGVQHGAVRFQVLAGDIQAELVQERERGQVRANEGSVVRVP